MPGIRKRSPSSSSESSAETSDEPESDELPQKSRDRYTQVWDKFVDFIRTKGKYPKTTMRRQPTAQEYSLFFRHLRNDENFKMSTIWSYYSLGSRHRQHFEQH
ncbi:hypothetical protein DIPPA_12335 [Diplonema papillatum]|nr:hypothetical protein DIPPA_12335 [Diplonema papillatum]